MVATLFIRGKIMKRFTSAMLAVLLVVVALLSVACQPPTHQCESLCSKCQKCTDLACEESTCASKCQGHDDPNSNHTCESVCSICQKCTDKLCTDAACASKCPGHDGKFNVTFETFDGNRTVVEVFENSKVQMPKDPSSDYATFLGWCSDASLQTPWNADALIVADTTVYANWDYKYDVTITLKLNNGEKNVKVQAHTGFLYQMPDVSRPEWNFTGWYSNSTCTIEFDTTKVLEKKSNFYLYAGWQLDENHLHEYKYEKTVEPTCLDIGFDVYTCSCGLGEERNLVDARGHAIEDPDDYIRFYDCTACLKTVRQESLRTYDEIFKYEFSQQKADEFDVLYQEILGILADADKYSSDYARTWDATNSAYDTSKDVPGLYDENKAFEEKFNAYYDNVVYVVEQYQYAYVFYCVNDGQAAYEEDYEFVSAYRTDMVKNFYSLYRLIHETKYREFFFAYDEGWTDEDIQSALVLSDSYGGEEYAEYNKKADEIQIEFRAIADIANSDEVPILYSEYVEVNNKIAQLAGYDNYMEYAYEHIYGRDYTPADVTVMSNFVKTYIVPIFNQISSKNSEVQSKKLDSNQQSYFDALTNNSIFTTPLTADLVADYFDLLYSEAGQAGKKEINFAYHANELFKNGNYYTGAYKGAFSYFIGAQDTAILYFGPGSYSGAFTFVHEFGHYHETVYNPGASISYDLEETHSQGDEMLFLAHLSTLLAQENCQLAYDKVMYDTISSTLVTILIATAVDEFEQISYTGEYNGTNQTIIKIVADGKVDATEYDILFSALFKDYGLAGRGYNSAYWRYVTIEAAGYYISYSMSALPSIELFVNGTQDFEAAKQSYFKLFTFTDNEQFAKVDEFGDLVVTAGYAETLEYAGLYSPFQEELYLTLKNYFEAL